MKRFDYLSLITCVSLILTACASSNNSPNQYCNNKVGYYCVQAGDTLYRIGQRFNTSVAHLKTINNLRSDTIHIGQSLKVSSQVNTAISNPINPQLINQAPLKWPLKGEILQYYSTSNRGIDIAAPAGSTIVAAADGQVIHAGGGVRGYGNLLLIKHSNTLLTAYANNDRLLVKEKARVKAGQPIATVGYSGRTDGQTALHFEVRVNGKSINPISYLPQP